MNEAICFVFIDGPRVFVGVGFVNFCELFWRLSKFVNLVARSFAPTLSLLFSVARIFNKF